MKTRTHQNSLSWISTGLEGKVMSASKQILSVCLIGISMLLSTETRSCPCPPCPPCYTQTGSYPNCECSYNCTGCEVCVEGSCIVCGNPSLSCCENTSCYNPDNQYCCGDGEGTVCNNDETCCEGDCCDNGAETCCDGSCVTSCYKLDLVPIDGWGCSDCGEIVSSSCIGEGVLIPAHYVWATAGPGESGWTKNPTKLDPIRSEIPCVYNWDVEEIVKCGAESVLCGGVCLGGWVPCVACLIVVGFDCIEEGGLLCNFVEDCETSDNPDDIYWVNVEVADLSGDLGCSCSR